MGRWGQCVLLIDVDIVFFRKKLNFFFQIFSVINMKVQLKYFYYCSIVIMVSRLGDWALGSVYISDRCRHSFFPEKVEIFFSNFFCNQYESSIEVFLLLFYCYNGIPFRGWVTGVSVDYG